MIGRTHSRGKSRNIFARRWVIAVAGTLISGFSNAANCTDTPVSGKAYYIVNEGSGLSLDVLEASIADGANVVQWTSNGQSSQQWTATDLGNGIWSLRPMHSNKSLDVYGWSKANGGRITQWSYSGNLNQQWYLSATGSGSIKIASRFSRMLVTVGDSNQGSAVSQRWDMSSANQRWYFNPVDGSCGASAAGTSSIGSGGTSLIASAGTSFMGSTKLLIGAYNDSDKTLQSAPFDIRYQYLSSGPAPDAACYASCKASPSCGGWWGCWQDQSQPPGQYATWPIAQGAAVIWQNAPHPQSQFWTYYGFLAASGGTEGAQELAAMANSGTIKRYLDDFRFLLQKLGGQRVMLHLEPDLWGFVRSINSNPHAVPAAVTSGNATDCGSYENSAAGLARCMIAMVRKYAPNATVGLHVSPWNYLASGDALTVASFMRELGATDGDFVVTDPADRDAAWYAIMRNESWHWWNDQSASGYLAWSKTLSETLGKPTVMWQIPLGNSSMNNTDQHWQDNKVDWLFSHLNDVAAAHVVALLFGAGESHQTSPGTDGGNLYYKTLLNWQSGGVPLR
ncbi:MAG TPA: RICIN domain-containing protein [Burkholderiaceae bacterium]|nr:RICIN domain-containing protein [Burkholderiaceae bacterium]